MSRSKIVGVMLLVTCTISIGCGDTLMNEVRQANETNVAKIANCYSLFKSRNDMKGPKDKEELVAFITGNPSIERNLERMGIKAEEFESYFVSERDGSEIIVHWGVDGLYVPPHVFEATPGPDGQYLIAGDRLRRVGEQEYQNGLNKQIKAQTPEDVSFGAEDVASVPE